jgi:hypothetical protein
MSQSTQITGDSFIYNPFWMGDTESVVESLFAKSSAWVSRIHNLTLFQLLSPREFRSVRYAQEQKEVRHVLCFVLLLDF